MIYEVRIAIWQDDSGLYKIIKKQLLEIMG